MNIVKAEAFINAAGYVVDQFRFTDPMRVLELNPGELEVLWQTLINAVVSGIDMRAFLRRRRPLSQPARVAQIAPSVRFNNEASDFATLVEFVGEDRPGLLYELSSAIAGMDCNIEVVLIDTEAHRAIDVFYITHHGEKLEADFEDQLEVDLIRAAEGIPR